MKKVVPIRDLYPNAKGSGNVRISSMPRRPGIASGSRVMSIGGYLWIFVFLVIIVLTILEKLFGVEVEKSTVGSVLGFTALAAALLARFHQFGSIIGRTLAMYYTRWRHQKILGNSTWEQFAERRGLEQLNARIEILEKYSYWFMPKLPYPDRGSSGVYTGQIAGGRALMGAVHLPGDEFDKAHTVAYLIYDIDETVVEAFPGTSFARIRRGVADGYLATGKELRLESQMLDSDCRIGVDGFPVDNPRWRILFDPVMIHGLAEFHDIEWIQKGDSIAFVWNVPNPWIAYGDVMDTLCAGASFVVERMQKAASAARSL